MMRRVDVLLDLPAVLVGQPGKPFLGTILDVPEDTASSTIDAVVNKFRGAPCESTT
jgi:hypothetical protein